MPIYEYRCQACGIELEKLQKLSDPLLRECPECGRETLIKLVSASSFRLKGGGWYETDFKTGKKKNGVGEADTGRDGGGDGAAESASKATGNEGASAASKEGSVNKSDNASDSKAGSKGEGAKKGDSKGNDNTGGKTAARETAASTKSKAPTSTGSGAG